MLRVVAYAIGSIMALGALFGALNSMHSAVAARTVEIATLRDRFQCDRGRSGCVDRSAVACALRRRCWRRHCVCGVQWYDDQHLGRRPVGLTMVYSLSITPSLVVIAVVLACALGLLGGVVPAIRAARSNVADALHET